MPRVPQSTAAARARRYPRIGRRSGVCRWEISVSEDSDAPGLPVFRGLRHSDGEVAQSPGHEPGVTADTPDSGSAKVPPPTST